MPVFPATTTPFCSVAQRSRNTCRPTPNIVTTGYSLPRDYFRSALHEVAHWCVAGAERRLLPDFGYWYAPDGRDAQQQRAFEQVEVKPQALEQLFCEAAGHRFSVSMDNLGGEPTDPEPFRLAVQAQRDRYLAEGLPERPVRFIRALTGFYRPGVLPQGHTEPYAGSLLPPGNAVCA